MADLLPAPVSEIKPVFVIDMTVENEGTSVRSRYEAPSIDEVILLAKEAGEKFGDGAIVVTNAPKGGRR